MSTSTNSSQLPAGSQDSSAQILQGYPKLATLMATYSEAAIFRKFSDLNMWCLLSLQAEIVDLWVELRAIWHKDATSTDPTDKLLCNYFRQLRNSNGSNNEGQLRMMNKLRKKLREYNRTLLQLAQISELKKPTKDNLRALREWLQTSGGGSHFQKGSEIRTWMEYHDDDLVSLGEKDIDNDMLSQWLYSMVVKLGPLLRNCLSKWQRHRIHDLELGPVDYYSDSFLLGVSRVPIVMISSMIPALTIMILYIVKSILARICIMIGFTGLFAATLAAVTSANRVEIFTATSA
ncbi:hypothetical protein V6Z79_008954 [Aspergillus fumigatus]